MRASRAEKQMKRKRDLCVISQMDPYVSPLERAFELAKSGACADLTDLRRTLRHEGYDADVLEGPSLLGQLKGLIRQAKRTGSAADRAAR